jgi:hypothetical protein
VTFRVTRVVLDGKGFRAGLKPGRFYLLPKIHKANNPGRSIVSANGHPTEKISEFVEVVVLFKYHREHCNQAVGRWHFNRTRFPNFLTGFDAIGMRNIGVEGGDIN